MDRRGPEERYQKGKKVIPCDTDPNMIKKIRKGINTEFHGK